MPEYLFKTNSTGESGVSPLREQDQCQRRQNARRRQHFHRREYGPRRRGAGSPSHPISIYAALQIFRARRASDFISANTCCAAATLKVKDWPTLNANATYYSGDKLAAFINWQNLNDIRSDGLTERIKMRESDATGGAQVMREKQSRCPGKSTDHHSDPEDRRAGTNPRSTAGRATVTRSPPTQVSRKSSCRPVSIAWSTSPSSRSAPTPEAIGCFGHRTDLARCAGLAGRLVVLGRPGEESTILKAASAYEAVTKHTDGRRRRSARSPGNHDKMMKQRSRLPALPVCDELSVTFADRAKAARSL